MSCMILNAQLTEIPWDSFRYCLGCCILLWRVGDTECCIPDDITGFPLIRTCCGHTTMVRFFARQYPNFATPAQFQGSLPIDFWFLLHPIPPQRTLELSGHTHLMFTQMPFSRSISLFTLHNSCFCLSSSKTIGFVCG